MNKRIIFCLLVLSSFHVYSATKYDLVLNRLDQIIRDYPAQTELFVIGKNDQGIEIKGVRISPTISRTLRTNHLVVAAHHGNEAKSTEAALVFIQRLLEIYQDPSNSYYDELQSATFHVIPVLNISGYNRGSRNETGPKGMSYDANRDYPDPCRNRDIFNLSSTKHLADYTFEKNIIGAITIHGYIGTFTFPWGTYAINANTSDHERFLKWATEATVFNNYRVGTHADVIYPAIGAYEDWVYFAYGIWGMLLELKSSPNYSNDADAMVSYFANVPNERSLLHEHGDCRRNLTREELMRSRP